MNTIQITESPQTTSGVILADSQLVSTTMRKPIIPKGHFESFNSESTMSDIQQISWGLYIDEKKIIIPLHVTCGRYKDEYFFEELRLQEMSGEYTGQCTRFSSALNLDTEGLPCSIPDSFLAMEKHLIDLKPEYSKEVHLFLLDIFSEHTLMWRYSDCLGMCQEHAEELYTQAIQKIYQYPIERYDKCDHYIADFKWVANGNPGTVKIELDADFEFYIVDALSSISVDGWRDANNGSGFGITLWDDDINGITPVAEFSSENTLPDSIPQASLDAIRFANEQYPDQAEIIGAMILGRTAWLLELDGYKDLQDMYRHVVKLFEEKTGLPAPTIRIDGKKDSMYEW